MSRLKDINLRVTQKDIISSAMLWFGVGFFNLSVSLIRFKLTWQCLLAEATNNQEGRVINVNEPTHHKLKEDSPPGIMGLNAAKTPNGSNT